MLIVVTPPRVGTGRLQGSRAVWWRTLRRRPAGAPAPPGRTATDRSDRGAVRVVHVFSCLELGGTELRTMELMPALTAAGIELHFLTMAGRPGTVAPRVRSLGGRVHCGRWSWRFPFRFLRLLRRLRPHAVHTHVDLNAGPYLLLAAVARVPVRIAQCHGAGNGGVTIRRRVRWSVFRGLLRVFATDVAGVSPDAVRAIHSRAWRADRRCRVVPDGIGLPRLWREEPPVDLRAAVGATEHDVVIIYVGRPDPVKRRWMIPPMVAALRDRGLSAHAVFVGPPDPGDDEAVRAAARRHRVGDRIRLWGPAEDVGGLLRQADVLAHPSAHEGLSGVVLEAVAVGTPVVASDLPGIRFITEHLSGIAFVPRDAGAPMWAEAIHEAVTTKTTDQDREDAVARFRRSIFSLETVAAQHLSLYLPGVDHGLADGCPTRSAGQCQRPY